MPENKPFPIGVIWWDPIGGEYFIMTDNGPENPDGRLVSIVDYPVLWSLFGTDFGSSTDGSHFRLPDFRERKSLSNERDPETDQVAPVHNDNSSCHDLVIEDLKERKAHGLRKYNTELQAFNGRSFTQDAYEEVLDLAAYLRGKLEEERIEKEMQDNLESEVEGHAYSVETRIPGLRYCPHPSHGENRASVCWKANYNEFMRGGV